MPPRLRQTVFCYEAMIVSGEIVMEKNQAKGDAGKYEARCIFIL